MGGFRPVHGYGCSAQSKTVSGESVSAMVVDLVFKCHTCGDVIRYDGYGFGLFTEVGSRETVPDRDHGSSGHLALECARCTNVRHHPTNPTTAGAEVTVFESYTRPDNGDTVLRTRVGDRHVITFVYGIKDGNHSPQVADFGSDATSAINTFRYSVWVLEQQIAKATV